MNRDVTNARVTFVVGDIHFDLHHKGAWEAFVQCVRECQPDEVVINGDFVDLGMLSRYRQGENEPLNAIAQIQCFVAEMKRIEPYTKKLTVIEGNHDERWGKIFSGVPAESLRGAKGLSMKEQCFAHGLPESVNWISESASIRGYQVGKYLIRHGHKQGSRFSSPQHIAATRINKSNGQSEIVGHHHRAQLFCRTAGGITAVGIAAPCMTGDHEYAPDADWQRGFVVIEQGERVATAYPVVCERNGSFAWAGRVYDAPKLLARKFR